ncbi:hypothetical protein EON65_15600 [archaeon]|nr:MAG: hypothetical protein EON65_15600 [archaeon]
MTRRAFIISTLVIVLSLIWEIVLAIDPVHTSRLLQDTGNDNSTDPDNPPPDEQHEHHPEGHDHSNYIYTASLMLVAVPTVVGLSAAAVLVKRSMTQHQSKGPAVSTDLEESKVDLADSEDDEEAKKSATSPSENTSGEKGDKPKNKASSYTYCPLWRCLTTVFISLSIYVAVILDASTKPRWHICPTKELLCEHPARGQ